MDHYRFRDVAIAAALQSLFFVSGHCKSSNGDDGNALGLIILFKQASHVKTGEIR